MPDLRRRCAAVLAVLPLLLWAVGARAQEPAWPCADQPETCGRQAFEAGIKAYQGGDPAKALEWFRRAQALKPHPVILFNVATAEADTGLLLEAVQHFDQVFSDPATPADKLDAARRERDRLTALLAGVSVDRDDAQLLIDGQPAPGSPPSVRVNPGQHQVQVRVGGKVVVSRVVDLAPGQRLELALAPPATEPRPKPPAAPPAPAPTARGLGPGWVVAGGGVAVLLGGITLWSGLDANAAYADFRSQDSHLSRSQAQARVDEGKAKDTRTNVLLGVTASVALATGALALFAGDWGAPGKQPQTSLRLGPGELALVGHF